uniref:U11/U12 small nuclear ribonucleoprotein 48 kDa protein n=1 Tax=Scatophagus argus TaxID=75038 RepID=UPI001ED8104A|nr:U11/U12 small nuclear ribonucleoprotein 48 kDa protein [Scatophagus argus]
MSDSLQTQSVQDRLDRVQELTEFTERCKKRLDDIFKTLGWSWDEKGSNQEPMEQCPYDPNHRVPVRSMEKHKTSCRLRKMGYSAEEQAEMYDPSVCYENSSVRTFTMDKSTQHQVILQARSAAPLMRMEGVFWQGQYSGQPVDVPQNHKRTVCDLTVADRLALYDHVVDVLNRQREGAASSTNDDLYVDLVSKLQKDEGQNEPKTHLELMAEMRDYKRRRQSYRAKNVHITKKSYTEVIREVINVHSEELSRQWREEEQQEEEEEPSRSEVTSHRRRPDERRSASSESTHGHSRRHRSRERSRERASKKKRKKEDRDSRSPDDHHHDRKKKKKKKKEERERS